VTRRPAPATLSYQDVQSVKQKALNTMQTKLLAGVIVGVGVAVVFYVISRDWD
jgi:hypothetical protein